MSFSLNALSFLMVSVFAIAALGYALGRVTVKGVSLGTAGVFVIALLYGAFFSTQISDMIVLTTTVDGVKQSVSYASDALKIVENLGLVLFVSSVGFIAGPNFFKNMKKNFKSYVFLGFAIILAGALAAIGCIGIGRLVEGGSESFDPKELTAIVTGLLSGALTSTPAFSASKETVAADHTNAVTVGYGIAYLFGVVGVVLFVQLIPRIVHADMNKEREKLLSVSSASPTQNLKNLFRFDDYGYMPFALAAVLGILIGNVKFFHFFSLTTTGGCLLASLVFSHFGRIGKICLRPEKKLLEAFRELGLMLFLIGAGVPGGMRFLEYFKPVYFVYGMIMTTVPMIIGYFIAKYILKMSLLNNLGAITGGMTSTPALGTLIHVSGTDDVASAYAATYPVALITVVVVCQLIINLF